MFIDMIDRILRKIFAEYLYLLLKNILSPFVVKCYGSKFSLFNLLVMKIMSNTDDIFIDNKGIKFGSIYRVPAIRGKRAWGKEPDTIKWIREKFRHNDVFYDIGANVGVYSLVANYLKNDLNVYAFEPESKTYAELNSNIVLNNASGQVQAFNVAVSDNNEVGSLRLSSGQPGMSDHQYAGDKSNNIGHNQGCVSLTIDSLVNDYNLPCPNHIKIDVDGLEFKILNGAKIVLASEQLRSIAVEASKEDLARIELFLRKYNFIMLMEDGFLNKEYDVRNYFFVKE